MICALVCEGSSDRVLLPVLRWLLEQNCSVPFELSWVDTRPFRPGPSLADKIRVALMVRPSELIFVHRDSDGGPVDVRYQEVATAAGSLRYVAVIPVPSTEAWLLHDEASIRAATGRLSGREPLNLPSLGRIEDLVDAKQVLFDALRTAHGGTGRRARQFDSAAARHRLGDLIEDGSPLRQLSSFRRLEDDTQRALSGLRTPTRR